MNGRTSDLPPAHRKRSASAQQGPPSDLTGFPVATIDPSQVWYREHGFRDGRDAGCWYFSGYAQGQPPQGRFDLPLPNGTCYLTETPNAAARERCGRFTSAGAPIPPGHYRNRVISAVQAPAGAVRIADATQAEAAHRHKVTRELFSCPDYSLPASWARALYMAGFDALLYEPRFGPGPGRAVALFGVHGRDRNREILSSVELAHTLKNMGLLPSIPSSRELRFDDSDAEAAAPD